MEPVCADAEYEEHTACACGCAASAQECNEFQRFSSAECRCVCANDHERAECASSGKFWNDATCQCLCRK